MDSEKKIGGYKVLIKKDLDENRPLKHSTRHSSMIGENKGALERVIGKAVHRFHDPSGFSRNQNSRKGT